jgi:hypothetical protein
MSPTEKYLRRKVEATCEVCGDYCVVRIGDCLSFELVRCKRCVNDPDDVELVMILEPTGT